MPFRRFLLLALLVAGLTPSLAQAAGVQPVFDLSSPSGSPFPSAAAAEVALKTITRPNATSARVTRTSRRCSSWPRGAFTLRGSVPAS